MFEHLEKRTLFSVDFVDSDHLEPYAPTEPPAVVDEPYWPEEEPSTDATDPRK